MSPKIWIKIKEYISNYLSFLSVIQSIESHFIPLPIPEKYPPTYIILFDKNFVPGIVRGRDYVEKRAKARRVI